MTQVGVRLIGAWSLLTYRRFRDGAFYRDTMGGDPKGRIIYDAGGTMAAFLMTAQWADGAQEPSWETFLAYSAHWQSRDEETVVHVVDFATIPGFVGRPLVRTVVWQDDATLKLITDGHVTREGIRSHDELVWQRESDEMN